MNPTGRIVREWRDGLKLSQSQFARLADVHPMTVSRWERGADVPLSAVAMYKLRKLHERMSAQAEDRSQRPETVVEVVHIDTAEAIDRQLQKTLAQKEDDSEPMLPGIVAEETTDA
jgi:transcriptional regulator with XRE-family HTH domain